MELVSLMLKTVIFDFDGVITDSEILHFRTFNEILSKYGVEISLRDYYKDYLGLSDFDLFKLLINNGTLKLDTSEIESLVSRKNEIFEKLAQSEGKIIEGVRDFLQKLTQNKITIAICSGALLSEIELVLEQANLRGFFEVIVSAEQTQRSKPYPDGFLLTLQKLNKKSSSNIKAEQCVVIEDSHWGIEAAKQAKMNVIAVTNSYDAGQLSAADKVVTHLEQISIEDLQRLCQ